MKLIKILLLLIVSLFWLTSSAQISESSRSMSSGNQNALSIDLPNTSEKFVEGVWKNYAKKNLKGKTKKDRKSGEWFTDDGDFVTIGKGNTLDVYSKIVGSGNNVAFSMWIDLGGSFVNSNDHPDRYNAAEKLLMQFALEVAVEQTKEELGGEEKKLKQLEGTLKKLEKDNDRYHQEIEDAKKRIARAEADIEKNIQEQENARTMIEAQMSVVENVNQKLRNLR